MLYLQELPSSVARRVYLFICFHLSSAVTSRRDDDDDDRKKTRAAFFGKDDTSHVRIDRIYHPNYLAPRMEEQICAARLAFETTPPFGSRNNRTQSSVTAAIHQDGFGQGSSITGSIHF